MPTLDWIGKRAVLNHHREIPFHLLKQNAGFSAGRPDAGNLVVQGDNLLALKALLPYYAQQVKLIYIDPPYNTGNEGWVYNDAVNGPEMQDWLGRVVGDEGGDLSRHDKWLTMMYPRLELLRQFLREDGAIFISIDDKEVHHLRSLMDEVFGPRNFVATVIWQKNYAPKGTAKHLSEDHDYIIVYAKDGERWRPNLVPRTDKQDKKYKNPDNDPRGAWRPNNLAARNYYSKGTYPITCPSGRVIPGPPRGSYWRIAEEKLWELDRDGRIWWGKHGNNVPAPKIYLSEVKQGVVPQTLWFYQDVGHTQEAKKELVSIVEFESSDDVFITPKPVRLMRRILEIGADKDSLVLDSFAGSGTLGHAVLAANKDDGGSRKFILVEMEPSIARAVTAQRLRKVIEGYTPVTGGADVEGLGGGIKFCDLAEPLFDESGSIRDEVSFPELAQHVYFTETGLPLPGRSTGASALLGVHDGTAVYLLYNGVLGDQRPDGGNVLTGALLSELPRHDGPKVIYGESCCLGELRLKREHIVFKQTPYDVRVV
ncbi:MAG: site-specific DNA-methyltransferase [Polyangiaceae bacterium]|nr:site-specific DNA-methyltransferase [Polyangiaceae bacterium]